MSTVITVGGALFDNSVTDAKLRDSAALSIIGRATNSSGDPTDIVASSDGDVLRRSGTTLGFGAIPESSVTGLVGDLASIASSLSARPTGSGTANKITKWSGASALTDSLLSDDGTTLAYNTNKFTVVAASGNTTIAGTADVTGDFKVNTNKFTVTASNGNTLVAGTLTISPMTSGSVLFAGTSGVVSQDNTAFNWNNTDKTLLILSPSATAFGAKSNSTTAGTMFIQNTNASGPSDFYVTDSAGTAKISWGYGNSSYIDTARAGRGYLWRNSGVVFSFAQTNVIDATIFSNGNWNIGSTTSDPGVKFRVEGAVTVTGNLIVNGSGQFDGGVTLGNGAGDAHAITGTLNANSTAGSNGEVLKVVSGVPQWSQLIPNADYGDITVSSSGTTWTIDNDVVTYAKMQNVSATSRFLGRISSGSGDVEELTGTQATTLLNIFTDTLKGLVPLSGGGTANFLRADGSWNAPSAVLADGAYGDVTVSGSGTVMTIATYAGSTKGLVPAGAGSTTKFLREDGAWAVVGGGGGSLSDGDYGDIVVSSSGAVMTIDADVVTDSKLRNSAALSVIGRSANSTGDPADIAASNDAEVLRRSGTALGFGTIATAGIANSAVTYAKIQDISATSRILGRKSSGSGVTEELSGSDAATIIGATAALSISGANQDAVTLDTEGTKDFFASTLALGTRPIAISNTSTGLYAPAYGGWILNSFCFVQAGITTFSLDTASVGSNRSLSSTADNIYPSSLTNNTTCPRMFSLSSPGNGWGFMFMVPADKTSRTLIVRFSQFSCVVRSIASMSDGSIADVTTDRDSGSGAGLSSKITVTFNTTGLTSGAWLIFRAKVTSRYTTDPGIQFGSATLA